MAAPTFIDAGTGVVIATGSATVSAASGGVADDLLILQVLQDGTTASAVSIAPVSSRVENLAGTDAAMTLVTDSPFSVGSPQAALQHLWIGRAVATLLPQVNVTTTGDDLYCRLYRFRDANLGTTLGAVIENATAGTATNGANTSTSVLDTAVTTLGADRLACNFIAVNDDNEAELTAMVGMTGGTWAYPVAAFGSATGTDGAVALVTAAMASAGTIDGGSDAITIDGWGVVGFALIGTTVSFIPRNPTINHMNPGVL